MPQTGSIARAARSAPPASCMSAPGASAPPCVMALVSAGSTTSTPSMPPAAWPGRCSRTDSCPGVSTRKRILLRLAGPRASLDVGQSRRRASRGRPCPRCGSRARRLAGGDVMVVGENERSAGGQVTCWARSSMAAFEPDALPRSRSATRAIPTRYAASRSRAPRPCGRRDAAGTPGATSNAAQSKRVRDDAHRRERHRAGGQRGAQQKPERRDRGRPSRPG